MATLALGAIAVPSSGVASRHAFLVSSFKPSSTKLTLRRSIRSRTLRSRTSVTAASFQVTLITPDGDKEVRVSEDECILDAAEKHGIDLPYICRSGACSSCVALLKSGTLNQDSQNFLNETQLEAGFALLCSSYPTSDCVIQTHQEETLIESTLELNR